MDKMKYLDEQIINLLDRVENYASEYSDDDPQDHVTEQSFAKGFIIDRKRIEFARREVIETKLSIMLPKDFTKMSPDIAKLKYPSEHRPQVIYTNPANTVNFWVTEGEDFPAEHDIEEMRDQVFATVTRLNPAVKAQQSGSVMVSTTKKVAYIEYSNPVLDGKIFNLMFMLSLKAKLMIGCFNCLTKESKYWRKPMLEMVKSMRGGRVR